MKRIYIILLCLLIVLQASAQDSSARKSVYKFRLSVDIPIGLMSAGLGIGALIKHKKKQATHFGRC